VPPGPLGASWEATGQKTVPMHSPAMGGDVMNGDTGHSGMQHGPAQLAAGATPGAVFEVSESDQGTIVILADNRFMPREIIVKAGTPLTFVNQGANWHSIAGADGLIDLGQLDPGESYSVVLDTPGTYALICKHHMRQGMTATLNVIE
jgi:plastocyanin